jgi:membrane dipeptidase
VGIYAVPSLLGPNADLSLMMAHVSHAVKTIGADHVAIGTDLGHQKPFPPEIRDYHTKRDLQERAGGWKPEHSAHFNEEHLGGSLSWVNWPLFTVGLVKMGLNDQQIAQILGCNLRRVLEATRPDREFRYHNE